MEIKHVCQSCGEVMAVHEHASYQEVKDRCTGVDVTRAYNTL